MHAGRRADRCGLRDQTVHGVGEKCVVRARLSNNNKRVRDFAERATPGSSFYRALIHHKLRAPSLSFVCLTVMRTASLWRVLCVALLALVAPAAAADAGSRRLRGFSAGSLKTAGDYIASLRGAAKKKVDLLESRDISDKLAPAAAKSRAQDAAEEEAAALVKSSMTNYSKKWKTGSSSGTSGNADTGAGWFARWKTGSGSEGHDILTRGPVDQSAVRFNNDAKAMGLNAVAAALAGDAPGPL